MKKYLCFLVLILPINLWGQESTLKFKPEMHIAKSDIEEHFVYFCDRSYDGLLKELKESKKLGSNNYNNSWLTGYLRCLDDASYVSQETMKFIKASNAIYDSKESWEIKDKKLNDLVLTTRAKEKIDYLLEYELLKIEIRNYHYQEEITAKEKIFKLAFNNLFDLRRAQQEIEHYIQTKYAKNNIELELNAFQIFTQMNDFSQEFDKFLEYRETAPSYQESVFFGRYAFFSLAQFYLNKNNPYFNLEKVKKYLLKAKKAEDAHKSIEIRNKDYYQAIQKTFDLFDEVIFEYQNNNNVWADYLYKKLSTHSY